MESNLKTKSELFAWSDGRRIVDLQELAKQLHCKQCSSLLDLQRTEREARYGLASVLYIQCTCGLLNDVHTSKLQQNSGEFRKTPMFEINIKLKASINVLMCGGGSSQTLSFLALLDIPVPPPSDASLVPVADDASITPHVPSSAVSSATTSTAYAMCSSTLLTRSASLMSTSSATQPLVSSVPQVLATVSSDYCTSAVQESVSDDDNSVSDVDDQHEYDNPPRHDISDEEEDGNDDGVCTDGDDEEYIPPAKVKPRSKPKPSPARKRKAAPRKSKNAGAKPPAKRTKLKGKTKTPKVVLKNIAPESGTKEEGEDMKDASEDEEDEPGRQHSVEDIDNPVEWSSVESEHDSTGEKVSDNSLHEEEQLLKDEIEPRPKRKRGRPRGSTNRAKHKQGRKPVGNVRKDSAEPTGTQGPAGEEKEVPSCAACAKEFNSVKGYNVHMKKVHNQDMKARPRKRGKVGGRTGEMAESEWAVVKEEAVTDSLYLCPVCQQLYSQAKCLAVHLKKAHQTDTQDVDAYGISMEGSVQRLKLAWKKRHRFVFKCLICQTLFQGRLKLSAHIRILTDQKTVTCENRNPDALRLRTYQAQLFLKEGDDNERHLCHICGAAYKKKYVLRQHVNSHEEASPKTFVCESCPYSTTNFINFRHHTWKRHPAKPRSRKHMCEICGKGFYEKSAMVRHVENVHLKNKYHQCELCFKVFNHTRGFLKHMKNHQSSRSHRCTHCGRCFNQAYNLKVHERLHTGEKPYQCQHCDAAFAQKNSLNVHMKKHQRKDGIPAQLQEKEKAYPCQGPCFALAQKRNLDSQISRLQEKAMAATDTRQQYQTDPAPVQEKSSADLGVKKEQDPNIQQLLAAPSLPYPLLLARDHQ